MADRSSDWLEQARRDLEQAEQSMPAGRHEWACFAAHQALQPGSVLRWPSAEQVFEQAERWAERWAERQHHRNPELLAVGVFGSYGRGDAGVGSDLDLVLILRECSEAIWQRLRHWPTGSLPLACDLLVTSLREWQTLPQWNPQLVAVLRQDTRWLCAGALEQLRGD